MSKVFPLQDCFVGGPNGGTQLRAHVGWRADHPFVQENPHLFTSVEEDPRDAEIERLKAELASRSPRKAAGS